MRPGRLAGIVLIAALLAGCGGLKFGSDFPSPTKDMLVVGKTTKADLLRFFGEPHQVGLDTGDPTWAWTYAQVFTNQELSKQLTVRFDEKGTVKSYSFTSSFPEDMARLK
ncbi:MAG: outer membrane protein assembly factor BamE [Candidatus Rokubacteria bacterium]|nr:outer membrane protein assembly factor BamE [Candidatus Rokubacteria bacterium]